MATKGQSEKGMTWSPQAAEKARAEHKYIKVGGKGGKLSITGAKKNFEKFPDFVYLPEQRIAGRKGDVVKLLQKYNQDVNAKMANAITLETYGTHAGYQQELEAYARHLEATKGQRTAKTLAAPKYTLKDLEWMVEGLDRVEWVPKTSAAGKTVKSPTSGGGRGTSRGAKKSILEKLNEATNKGKVLDVSSMKEGFTGIRSVQMPQGKRTRKIMVPGLNIIADPSKFANYQAVVQQLGPDYSKYIDQFRRMIMPGGSEATTTTPAVTNISPTSPSGRKTTVTTSGSRSPQRYGGQSLTTINPLQPVNH